MIVAYEFCSEINAEELDVTITTPDYPAKAITNPTCSCDFSTENKDAFFLQGYAMCNVRNISVEY